MKNERLSSAKPFLTNYEVAIPERLTSTVVEYDESQMILLVDGKPVIFERDVYLNGETTHTCVEQETTDDN